MLWTDVLLSLVIFGGFLSLVTVGLAGGDLASRGGLLDRARSQRRLERGSFAVDITDNDSYINIFIGQLIFWTVAYSAFYSLGKAGSKAKGKKNTVHFSFQRYKTVLFIGYNIDIVANANRVVTCAYKGHFKVRYGVCSRDVNGSALVQMVQLRHNMALEPFELSSAPSIWL